VKPVPGADCETEEDQRPQEDEQPGVGGQQQTVVFQKQQ